jgi:DNA-binding MarR family transcriptional regulator
MSDKVPTSGARSTGFLLQRAHNLLRAQMQIALDGSELHLGHISILGSLAAHDGLTQRDLGRRTGIEKSSMVNFIDALEAAGFVRRIRDAKDRRAYALRLSVAGLRMLSDLGPRMQSAEAAFFAPLSPAEQRTFSEMLAKLVLGSGGASDGEATTKSEP